jgi:hypothetical protein
MESWQSTAAPAARSSGGTRLSFGNGPSGMVLETASERGERFGAVTRVAGQLGI